MSDWHATSHDPVTVPLAAPPLLPRDIQTFLLTVARGPDAGLTLLLGPNQEAGALVGRGPACALRLTDPTVSRRHANFEILGNRVRIVDLGSPNGTRVNGVSILEGHLRGGESVTLGATTLRVSLGDSVVIVPSATDLPFGRVMGSSNEMRRIVPLCRRLANLSIPVVIEGETGTGKEVLAEALHEAGPRRDKPFVVFDCTTVPPNLVESELFGHERGAFTGATALRKGVFEQAHGGTLLIDEIGDLELSLQPKLLRAIERSEVRRVGGHGFVRVDVRVLVATRRDLDREIQTGRFRDDLFHRIAGARIELPPLRRRRGDVAFLARHFCRELSGGTRLLPDPLIAKWEDHAWPGNVRELHHAVEHYLALGDLDCTRRNGLEGEPDPMARVLDMRLPLPEARQKLLREFERRYIERVLEEHGGSAIRAAAASGIAKRYFHIIKRRARE